MVAESPANAFVMHGAREVLAQGALHIERHVVAIEEAVEKNPGLAFDLAKALIESACKTILTDRGDAWDEGWDLPKLLKETTSRLQLVPDNRDGTAEVAASLKKTLGGLQTVIQGLCELRNRHGFASHGKGMSDQELETIQALLAARASDAIVSFLFRAHRRYSSAPPDRRLVYDDHSAFNRYVDEANGTVRVFDLEYQASEVLFSIDEEAYRDLLATYTPDRGEPDATAADAGPTG
jgi:Abortive infection C-terminus